MSEWPKLSYLFLGLVLLVLSTAASFTGWETGWSRVVTPSSSSKASSSRRVPSVYAPWGFRWGK